MVLFIYDLFCTFFNLLLHVCAFSFVKHLYQAIINLIFTTKSIHMNITYMLRVMGKLRPIPADILYTLMVNLEYLPYSACIWAVGGNWCTRRHLEATHTGKRRTLYRKARVNQQVQNKTFCMWDYSANYCTTVLPNTHLYFS